jgi:hypothetical protein
LESEDGTFSSISKEDNFKFPVSLLTWTSHVTVILVLVVNSDDDFGYLTSFYFIVMN